MPRLQKTMRAEFVEDLLLRWLAQWPPEVAAKIRAEAKRLKKRSLRWSSASCGDGAIGSPSPSSASRPTKWFESLPRPILRSPSREKCHANETVSFS